MKILVYHMFLEDTSLIKPCLLLRIHSPPQSFGTKALLLFLCLCCRCYIKFYDSPSKSTTDEDDDMAKLLPSQKKKMRQKQRKAEARAKKVLPFVSVPSGDSSFLNVFLY